MTQPHSDSSGDWQEEAGSADDFSEEQTREEILESMLERTKHYLDKQSFHERFTEYVREHRLSSKFDFENLTELVRCVLERSNIKQLPINYEECVNWIATCIYEDPLTNERAARFWGSIINRIQG